MSINFTPKEYLNGDIRVTLTTHGVDYQVTKENIRTGVLYHYFVTSSLNRAIDHYNEEIRRIKEGFFSSNV